MSMGYHFTSFRSSFKMGPKWAPEKGSTLMEVVMASLVLGVAIVGVALMFSSARSMVVAHGDERVEIYLAQEKLENLRAQGFAATTPGAPPGVPCTAGVISCYYETNLIAGEDTGQKFTRKTWVDCVVKDGFSIAPGTGNCPAEPVLKRLRVEVTSPMHQADIVVLQTVLATSQKF